MLSIITDKSEIKNAQDALEGIVKRSCTQTFKRTVGYKAGAEEVRIGWSNEFGFWFSFQRYKQFGRFWSLFGIDSPKTTQNLTIVCEINVPFSGINRQVGGVFAKDADGEIYLLHRGKIGGGRVGIGKGLFFRKYTGKIIPVSDGDRTSDLAIIGKLRDKNFVAQLRAFIFNVHEAKDPSKNLSKAQRTNSHLKFNEEFTGIKEYSHAEKVTAECNHGAVVRDLRRTISSLAPSLKWVNSRNKDLFGLSKNGKVDFLFEVKTKTDSQSIYTAIGQLYYNSCGQSPKGLILVCPSDLSVQARKIISDLGIKICTFTLKSGTTRFEELATIMKRTGI